MNKLLSCVILLFSLAGCAVPEIATSTKSPSITGRVLDAETGTPLEGATIAFVEMPSVRGETRADGSFAIDATHNVHFIAFLGMCGSEWPEGHYYTALKVSKPGYLLRTLDIYDHNLRESDYKKTGDQLLHLKDVSLEPEKNKPNQPPVPMSGLRPAMAHR